MNYTIVSVTILFIIGMICAVPVPPESGEYGDEYQGDILLTPNEIRLINSGRSSRTGVINTNARWPKINGRYTVPYVIDRIYMPTEIAKIHEAMREIESKTCVTFVPRTTQVDYVSIYNGNGCNSYVGRIGGRQNLSLKRNSCLYYIGTIMHELIHALGYGHMHQHPDRDQKTTIKWENIRDVMVVWFDKLSTRQYNNFGTPYDLSSVMHYGPTAFSKNGLPTMVPKLLNDLNVMGQRTYLSTGDITRINNMYVC